jgi:hypothetical protein
MKRGDTADNSLATEGGFEKIRELLSRLDPNSSKVNIAPANYW